MLCIDINIHNARGPLRASMYPQIVCLPFMVRPSPRSVFSVGQERHVKCSLSCQIGSKAVVALSTWCPGPTQVGTGDQSPGLGCPDNSQQIGSGPGFSRGPVNPVCGHDDTYNAVCT